MPTPKKKRTHLGDQEGLKLASVTDNVTPEEAKWRYEELQRCKDDIDYFAEHYFHIINAVGEKTLIKMFPKQRQFLHLIRDNRRVIALAARQMCKSTTYSIFCLYQIIFQQNYFMMIAGNKGDIAREILGKIKECYELVPNWMKPGIKVWNESKIVFENGVTIKSTNLTPTSGRGSVVDLLLLDELAFVDPSTQDIFFTSCLPTTSSRPTSRIVVCSTPNGSGDLFHRLWIDATTNKESVWKGIRMDWWERPDRDDKWKEMQLKSLGSQEKFDQEYGNSFTVVAGNKLITDEKLIMLKERVEKTMTELDIVPTLRKVVPSDPNSKSYTEYFPVRKGRTYIGAVDTAEGTGEDSSVFYIFDITEGSKIYLVAKFDSAKVIPSEYGEIIYNIGKRYGFPPLLVESNSCGMVLIESMTKTGYTDHETKQRSFYTNIIDYNRKKNKQPGIFSHVTSKTKACMNVQQIVQSGAYELVLGDSELLSELAKFERVSSSQHMTYKAKKGYHDDHAMAFVWGMFVYNEEILTKYFTVEYRTDPNTGQKTTVPELIVPISEDVDEVKRLANAESREKSDADKYNLAVKWREMGDVQRSDYILSRMYSNEWGDPLNEGTSEDWARNPYQLDPSMFSEGLFGERYRGQGRGRGGWSTGWDDYGFGCVV